MRVFFRGAKEKQYIEFFSYICFFVVVTGTYCLIDNPTLTMFITFIILVILTFNYHSTLRQRMFALSFICLTLFCIEITVTLVGGSLQFVPFAQSSYTTVFNIIFTQVLTYILVLTVQNYKNIKDGDKVPTLYWVATFLIPSASLYITVILFYAVNITKLQLLICIILLLAINITSFHLYNYMIAASADKLTKMKLMQLTKSYESQFELMKTSLAATKAIRHDLINHTSVMQTLVKKEEYKKFHEYCSELVIGLNKQKTYSNSGNIIMDSILNFKLQEADQKKIKINLDLNVPDQINISTLDLTVILCNLLDNAILASSKLEQSLRVINVRIWFDKSRLMINIGNNYDGILKLKNNHLISSKKNANDHGIGLNNVRQTVDKYEGVLNIDYTTTYFTVIVLMFTNINQ